MQRGRIIVVEGTECSGKETQTSLIVQRLKREGKKVEHLAFPMYDTPTGMIVGGPYLGKDYICKSYFKEDIIDVDPKVAALYYAADRRYNLKIINEFLYYGYDLIIDLYVESNMAHQGCKISNKEERFKLYKWFATLEYDLLELPRPNLTILLHMPYQKTMELKGEKSDNPKANSNLNYYKNSEDAYLELAKMNNHKVISCVKDNKLRDILEIHEEIYNIVKSVL